MDLENLSQILNDKYNSQGIEDFSGFSPSEMYQIIYSPFHTDCPIKINTELEPEYLDFSPIFQLARILLQQVQANEKIKLTN